MGTIKTILVPFDFSAAARAALDYAVNYAGPSKEMHIKLLYADDHTDASYLEKDFQAIRKGYGKNLKAAFSWTLSRKQLTQAILKARDTYHADLIIMGTSGPTGTGGATSHTSELVLEANCPVLVIPQPAKEFRIKKIALVLGRDEIDDTSDLATLLDVARRFNARVHVLTIENEPGEYGYSASEEKNEKLLEHFLESFYADHTYITNPAIAEGISRFTADKDIDMIAIMPGNHRRYGKKSAGQLTNYLTLNSKTPVLAID